MMSFRQVLGFRAVVLLAAANLNAAVRDIADAIM
jgi:hypothetical protein